MIEDYKYCSQYCIFKQLYYVMPNPFLRNEMLKPSTFCMFSDKESDPIYKGNDAVANNDKKQEKSDEEKAEKAANVARKEKSVLQAKLTKLAIQIGYAGENW